MARTAVVAGTATAVAGGMSRRQQGKAAAGRRRPGLRATAATGPDRRPGRRRRRRPGAAAAAAGRAAAAPEDDIVAQLTKLGELKAQGILTEEEFAAAEGEDPRRLTHCGAPSRRSVSGRLDSPTFRSGGRPDLRLRPSTLTESLGRSEAPH